VGVDKPPKLSEEPARPVKLEVLPPLQVPPVQPVAHADGPPIHGLSSLILIAVDSLWAIFDWVPPVWIVAIPACFAAVFIPTYLIQRNLKNDSKGRALTFATILAVLAAIPTPITGTPVGLGLLAWTGLGKLLGRTPPK
jgi:integral membrane sensor domain MASE1